MTSSVSFCAEAKPDAAVDDWEAIATDEEKGESLFIHTAGLTMRVVTVSTYSTFK